MMRKYIVFVLLLVFTIRLNAQQISKPAIDNETYKKFRGYSVGNPKISNNGKYVAYDYSTPQTGGLLVIESHDGKFKKEFKDSNDPVFTEDNHWVIFNSADGLLLFDLIKKQHQLIEDARTFSVPENGDGRWLSYQLGKDLVLKDLASGKEKRFVGGFLALFNLNGTALVVQTDSTLQWVVLPSLQVKNIYLGSRPKHLIFDPSGKRIAFMTNGGKDNMIYDYLSGGGSVKVLITTSSPDIKAGLKIADDALRFSGDGSHVFFKFSEAVKQADKDSLVLTDNLDVWSYTDEFLQSAQLSQIKRSSKYASLKDPKYTAVVSVADRKVLQLENADTKIVTNSIKSGKYVLVENVVNDAELYWNTSKAKFYMLISTLDGSRKTFLPKATLFTGAPSLSPDEKFVVWYNPSEKVYMSYETASGVTRVLTHEIKLPLWNEEHESIAAKGYAYGIAGWLSGDKGLLVYDRYDIWQVDPYGKKAAVNITNGYGRQKEICFRISQASVKSGIFQPSETLLLVAFNKKKQNGFWKKKLGVAGQPVKQNMESCLYYYTGLDASYTEQQPIKATNAEVYVVRRETASEFPNWHMTTNFKSYRKLTNAHPEKEYNWLTSELIDWNLPDGRTSQGILYKPENFDSSKKYPVIFYYYEKLSNGLNIFPVPELSAGTLDVSWYVSHGYLVFKADIHYTIGHPALNVVNSVVSAAEHLSKLPYVDKAKMGLQGHSFGGWETNWLVANSNIFAAAQESAGGSNIISSYGGLSHGENHRAGIHETSQGRVGATPWDNPNLYIENSPIFRADKITTPLLIMHNKEDSAVPFGQAVELFTALRRLQKPVWMLQYDGEGHTLGVEKNQLDFAIRQQQFFDHYLKGKSAPLWMTRGIKAKDKGLESGLGLDIANTLTH